MLHYIEKAKQTNYEAIVFSELVIPGYFIGDLWKSESFVRECERCNEEVIAASEGLTIIFGSVAVDRKKRNRDGSVRKYNAFFVARDGKLIAPKNFPYPFSVKTLLPNYSEFSDSRYFFSMEMLALELGQSMEELLQPLTIPLGKRNLHCACLLCEDGWDDNYGYSPLQIIASHGNLDCIFNISASPYTEKKDVQRRRIFSRHALRHAVPLFYVNNIGLQNIGKTMYTFDGASAVYGADGNILLQAPNYESGLFSLGEAKIEPLLSPEAHIYQTLTYGIKTFLQQIRLKKIVIGISGGIDSAVAAALYAQVVGSDNLFLVNMPSRYNSQTTRNLAMQLAENLNCFYLTLPIEKAVQNTVQELRQVEIRRPQQSASQYLQISGLQIENIQARDRSSRLLAGVAAAVGGVFTCNANKTEMSVGYSTLYGDLSGFLAALADLWKYQVYALGRYLNEQVYGRMVIPEAIFSLPPSAELSAAQDVEAGKGDPIHYDYHDYLFRSFVARTEQATPEDILLWYRENCLEAKIGCAQGLVKRYFPTDQAFVEDLERWWNLFSGIAVAKRLQAPPVLAVSDTAYGFDWRESQNRPFYSQEYYRLRRELLK